MLRNGIHFEFTVLSLHNRNRQVVDCCMVQSSKKGQFYPSGWPNEIFNTMISLVNATHAGNLIIACGVVGIEAEEEDNDGTTTKRTTKAAETRADDEGAPEKEDRRSAHTISAEIPVYDDASVSCSSTAGQHFRRALLLPSLTAVCLTRCLPHFWASK